jgi:hypothetical protein
MPGFVADPGADVHTGQTAEIARRLGLLGHRLGVTIHAISGYRTPAHSVAVGGFANDPHTKGQAIDIGVNGSSRASAAQLTDAQLASVGLVRPFGGAQEINHIQLAGGVKSTTPTAAEQGAAAASAPSAPGATDFASDPVGSVVSALLGPAISEGFRMLLYAFLVFGGIAVAAMGALRLAGAHPTKREAQVAPA